MNKLFYVFVFWLLLIGQASGSNITISGKDIYINGTKTFPVYMYAVCHESIATNCTTNAINNTNFTFHIPYTDASPSDATLTTWQKAFETGNIFWNTRSSTTGNVYVSFNSTKVNSSKFFGYHQIDEPTGTGNETIENMTIIYNQVKANDSLHPISVNFGRGTYNPWLWNGTGDILMWDGYSIKKALDTSRGDIIMDWDLRAYSQFLAYGGASTFNPYHNYTKPWLVTVQGNGNTTSLLQVPTEYELRALTYSAITHDVQGIGFWGYNLANGSTSVGLSSNASLFVYADKLAREITGINNVMVLPTKAHSWHGEPDWTNVTITPNPTRTIESSAMYNFSYILKNDSINDTLYLIVVNKANVSQSDRQINIPSLAGTGNRTVTTLGLETIGSQAAGRTLTSVNGVFNDSFDPYASHIYEINQTIRYSISGYVIDNYGYATSGVSVASSEGNTTTNSTGYYLISNFLDGTYNLNFSKSGYSTGSLSIIVSGANATNQNIVLTITNAQSAYKTSTCKSTLGWGEVGSALLIVLIVVMAGGLAIGFLTGTLKMDTFPIQEFVLTLVAVVVIGGIGVAIINPIIIVVGCP